MHKFKQSCGNGRTPLTRIATIMGENVGEMQDEKRRDACMTSRSTHWIYNRFFSAFQGKARKSRFPSAIERVEVKRQSAARIHIPLNRTIPFLILLQIVLEGKHQSFRMLRSQDNT